MKVLIEEKDGSDTYRPIPLTTLLSSCKELKDRFEIYVPNACGGETRITIFKE